MLPRNQASNVGRLPLMGLAITVLTLASCDRCSQAEPANVPAASASTPSVRGNVEIVTAPSTHEPIADVVRRERARSMTRGRKLIVYVGAPWCEPCQRFHSAAVAGKLDAMFPDLRVLEFDLERDRERLAAAGYSSKLIPLFAVPDHNGRPRRSIEGSIKGDGAVDEITPRLRKLLDDQPTQ